MIYLLHISALKLFLLLWKKSKWQNISICFLPFNLDRFWLNLDKWQKIFTILTRNNILINHIGVNVRVFLMEFFLVLLWIQRVPRVSIVGIDFCPVINIDKATFLLLAITRYLGHWVWLKRTNLFQDTYFWIYQ